MRRVPEAILVRVMMITSRPPVRATPPRPKAPSGPSVLEGTLAGVSIGSNWGTVGGATIGGVVTVAGCGYLGLRVGAHLGPWGAAAGAVAGAAGAFLQEREYHLGSTAGGFVGLVAGGVIGGAIGAVYGIVR